jgi:hypothetical protein
LREQNYEAISGNRPFLSSTRAGPVTFGQNQPITVAWNVASLFAIDFRYPERVVDVEMFSIAIVDIFDIPLWLVPQFISELFPARQWFPWRGLNFRLARQRQPIGTTAPRRGLIHLTVNLYVSPA